MEKKNKIDAAIDKTVETAKNVANEVKTSEYVQQGVAQGRSLIQILIVVGIVLGIGAFILYSLDDKPKAPQITDPNAPTPITNYVPNTYYPVQTTHTNQVKENSPSETPTEVEQHVTDDKTRKEEKVDYNYSGPRLYETIVQFTDVPMRETPNIMSNELYKCSVGDKVYVIETNCPSCGNYVKVFIHGYTGYIVAAYLK